MEQLFYIKHGDFRQILPVVKNGTERKIIEETIKFSELWPLFKVLKLNKNLRCIDKDFQNFYLKQEMVKLKIS